MDAARGLEEYERWLARARLSSYPFEGLTHGEIAERLQLPVGTVKSGSFRAQERLAAELGHLRGRRFGIGLP